MRPNTQPNTSSWTSCGGGLRLRQPGVIRHPLGVHQAQELQQRRRIRAAPFDPALGVDALEYRPCASGIPAGRDRRCAHLRRVVRLAGRLGERVEAGLDQHPLQPIVETCPGDRGISSTSPPDRLPIPLPTQRHPGNPPITDQPIESESVDFVNTLVGRLHRLEAERGLDQALQFPVVALQPVVEVLHLSVLGFFRQ